MSSQWNELLKKCPFCGRRAEFIQEPAGDAIEMYTECVLCKARTASFFAKKDDPTGEVEHDAIDAWNERVER